MAKKAILAGATGLVGGETMRLLAGDGRFDEVTLLSRSGVASLPPKMNVKMVDWASPSKWADEVRADVVICCLGSTIKRAGSREAFRGVDFGMVDALAKAARENGVPHFILVSALGAKIDSSIFYMRVKGEAERSVLDRSFPSVTIVRPSLLTGHRKEKRFGESVARAMAPVYDFIMIGPLRKYRSVSGVVVARALVESAARAPAGLRLLEGDAIAAYALAPHD